MEMELVHQKPDAALTVRRWRDWRTSTDSARILWYVTCTGRQRGLLVEMIKEADAASRKQAFLLCRYVQILATGLLAFVEVSKETSCIWIAAIFITALVSNMLLSQTSPYSFFDPRMQAPVLVSDTMMISFALMMGHASQQSFLFFFFVLIMAAKVESLGLVAICAAAIGLASFLIGAPDETWTSPTLMRIPFMFAAGVFFAYVVLPERTGQMYDFNGVRRIGSISIKRADIREVV